ncbi:MAG: alpha-L-rhamnosidase, partial [Kiritimatiellae bacterium]|nr:alpha-L-rhamnosidase [Kiritimatiellia bacterium]
PDLVRVHDFCKHSILATTFTGKFVDGDRERLPYEADSYITQLGTYAVTSDDTIARAMADYLATHTTWPTEWKQFFISILHADWMHSGKTDLLEKHYAAMRDSKSWRHLRRNDGLLVTGGPSVQPAPDREKPEDIVDWAMCYRDGFTFCDVNTVVNALHIRNLRELAAMAAAIGRNSDAVRFAAEAGQTFAAFNARLWDAPRGRYRDGVGTDHATVQGNAMALACGAVPPERVAAVADFLVSKGFSCSTYMAQFVLEALFMAGRDRDAIALMTTPAFRGWLAMMARGATITPEFWDITMSEAGRIPDMNHAWSTAPLNAITRFVAGVRPTAPGFAAVEIAPQFGPLTHIQATVPTPRGPVSLDLRRNGAAISGTVAVPSGIQAAFSWHGRRRALRTGANDLR